MASKPRCTESYMNTSKEWNKETPSTTNTTETEKLVTNISSADPARPQMRRAGKRYSDPNEELTDVFNSVHDYFKRPYPTKDRFDLFGAAVAAKLRDLTKRQRILAEKIINETLFEAEMENLTITHKVINSACQNATSFTNTSSPVAQSTASPMQNTYFASNPNILVGYPTQLAQPIPQTTHQTIIHPQTNIAVPNPAVVEISIPESAAHYWATFNYDNSV